MLKVAASNQFGIPNQTDAFYVDGNGTLHVSWVVGAGAWSGPVAISQPGLYPPGAAVATSAQFGMLNQTDVFVVDKTGTLHVYWVTAAGAWSGPTPIGRPGQFPPGAGLAASNQFGIPNQTDVFAVDKTGTLNVYWVVANGPWSGPFQISQPGLFPPGAPVAASNQYGLPNQTDVFAVDKNGTLNVYWVTGAGAWSGPTQIGQPGLFAPGAALAAANQLGIPNQTDLFAVDKTGTLNVFWVTGADAWSGPHQISQPGQLSPGAAVAVSGQFGMPNQTDVFVVDKTGTLGVYWVTAAGPWSGPTPIGHAERFAPGAPVAAANQFGIPNQTDVFAFDQSGALTVSWVVGGGAWNGPIPIPS